jgi:dihydroorotase
MTSSDGVQYDVLITGGRVIDPGLGLVGELDVAIAGGKIAAVQAGMPRESAGRVVDASGQFVTPGLIDLHTHIYWGATYWGIEPDPVAARSGVTTWLDVGSAGAYSFPGFRRYVAESSKSRVFSLLNLSAIGLIAPTYEFANLDYCDVELAASIVEENRDLIVGIKARIDAFTTRGTGIKPLALARELADQVQLPLMVHIGTAPPSLDEICEYLRPGDILTHCFTGQANRVVQDNGLVNANIKNLHDRGLILDIGHGAGSFSFETAERMLDQGIMPDVISTDIHQLAIQGPMFDMPTTLSKFLLLGMTIEQVFERATSRPAAAMRKPEVGGLKPGAAADVALFAIEEGEFTFQDIHLNERQGTQRLVNTLTIIDGEELPRIPERPLHIWSVLPDHQRGKVIPLSAVSV